MGRSIRRRLQLWYTFVLLAAVCGFGAIMYDRARAAKFDQIDTKLRSAALLLDSSLRMFPPQMLDPNRPEPFRGGPDGPPFGPGPEGKGGRGGDKKGGRDRFGEPDDRRGPPPFGKSKGGGPNPRGGPNRPPPERLLAELSLPEEFQGRNDDGFAFAIWRKDGKLFKALDWPNNKIPAEDLTVGDNLQPVILAQHQMREAHLAGPFESHIVVARPVQREQAELRTFLWQLISAGAGVLAVGFFGGVFVSNRMFQPINEMTKSAAAISATNLSERIDTSRIDIELAELANVLNGAFDRLETAFEKQAQFTADASHELRTPLAVIRSSAELALSRPRSAEQYQEALTTCINAAQRMTNITDGLLTLARADAGQEVGPRGDISLDRVVADAVSLMKPLADERQVSLNAEFVRVHVSGDASALSRLVSNLVANALQYNQPGGEVHIALTNGSEQAVLTVSDNGIGIPAEDLPHVFDRFYRVDKARSRAAGGAGLGLAICRELVQAHGGTIDVTSELERGTTFTVKLPRTKQNL